MTQPIPPCKWELYQTSNYRHYGKWYWFCTTANEWSQEYYISKSNAKRGHAVRHKGSV